MQHFTHLRHSEVPHCQFSLPFNTGPISTQPSPLIKPQLNRSITAPYYSHYDNPLWWWLTVLAWMPIFAVIGHDIIMYPHMPLFPLCIQHVCTVPYPRHIVSPLHSPCMYSHTHITLFPSAFTMYVQPYPHHFVSPPHPRFTMYVQYLPCHIVSLCIHHVLEYPVPLFLLNSSCITAPYPMWLFPPWIHHALHTIPLVSFPWIHHVLEERQSFGQCIIPIWLMW